MLNNNTFNNIEEIFDFSINYASSNSINKIIIFAKGIDNIILLHDKIQNNTMKNKINIIATTFPMNQKQYQLNPDDEIEEITPEIFQQKNTLVLKELNIPLVSSTLPLDPIVIPRISDNPYDIIQDTLDLFGPGVSLAIQSILMSTDTGYILPGERVLSLTSKSVIDANATNSRFLFHPVDGIKINQLFK